jgi:hypothetical protein
VNSVNKAQETLTQNVVDSGPVDEGNRVQLGVTETLVDSGGSGSVDTVNKVQEATAQSTVDCGHSGLVETRNEVGDGGVVERVDVHSIAKTSVTGKLKDCFFWLKVCTLIWKSSVSKGYT